MQEFIPHKKPLATPPHIVALVDHHNARQRHMIDLQIAIKQKCRDCQHFSDVDIRMLNPGMGYCTLLETTRHERFWCEQWALSKS